MRRAWPAALLSACAPVGSGETFNPPVCDPRDLGVGQVRARRVPCAAEGPSGGDTRAGDWLLQNALVRYVIRGAHGPLTRLEGAGGTVIDAAPVGADDVLIEATPTLDGRWFDDVEITAWNEEDRAGVTLSGTLDDGLERSLTYTLNADDRLLYLSEPSELLVVAPPGSALVGPTCEAGADGLDPGQADLFGATGEAEDLGGWMRWEGADALVAGAREDVGAALWPTGLDVSGRAEGTWVEATDAENVLLARLPVIDGAFAGLVPVETLTLRAAAEGYGPGASARPGPDLDLSLGAQGVLRVRVVDQDGEDLPATLIWNGAPYPLAAGGGDAAVGPGLGDATLWAGPACEALSLAGLSVSGVVDLDATLSCPVTPAVLAWLGREAWPDRDERRRPEDLLFSALAEGVGYAVLGADDEVATAALDRHTGDLLLAEAGSIADTDTLDQVLAWPWSQDDRAPAHGAVDWHDASASTLIGAMSNVNDRIAVVQPAWVEAAGAPSTWRLSPRALRLGSLADLPTYEALLDAWVPVAAVGPRAWLDGLPDERSAVDAEAALVEGRTTATNGPRIVLRVRDQGPGGEIELTGTPVISLRVEAPSWMPLSGAALIGTGGQELARWALSGTEPTRLDTTVQTPLAPGWVLAVAWGDDDAPPLLDAPAWAVTSPVWISRP